MRLSTKTRYGVRAIFDLAYHADASGAVQAQARDIADRQQIPLRYLEQIFQDLKRAGLVIAKRGPRGGYTLRRPPAEIRLGDIVRALQGPIEAMIVIDDDAARADQPQVATAGLWQELAAHVAAWFDRMTVLDLVQRAGHGDPAAAPMYFI
ncbi:MAG: Rrf2 family transcriptional regulator [Deltaproteobacteria bacterium]|nr:Rrf2 family transcriptional regulator [Deltaproteobacteria bacterium]